MMLMFFMSLIFSMILILMIFLMMTLSMKKMKFREKLSSFECGFDPMSSMRKPFSIQFYLLSILFLIFDIEIVIIIPFIYYNLNMFNYMMLNFILILFILLIGIIIEWKEGAFNWMK